MIKNIMLVHGGLVDGSSWAKIIPLLEAQGHEVTAVQNPLTSLADDVATTRRALALQDGPVLLVGHSWGGVVITEAGTHPAVVGLAYVCAFAPAPGQSLAEVAAQGPTPAGGRHFTADAAGFARITRQGLDEDLAPDATPAERRLLYATQKPLAATSRGEKVTAAAWQTKPSWFLVTELDRVAHPELQRLMAERMGATVRSVAAGHLPLLSQPAAVAAFILEVARQVG